MNHITNTEELRAYMAKTLVDCDDPRKVAASAVKTAAVGKIISSIALDLQHMHMRKEIPDHPWCRKGEMKEIEIKVEHITEKPAPIAESELNNTP